MSIQHKGDDAALNTKVFEPAREEHPDRSNHGDQEEEQPLSGHVGWLRSWYVLVLVFAMSWASAGFMCLI